jgi:Fe-Mn family superoxide dismutase
MAHTLPPLPYDYSALEPVIDEETMRLHHDKHHGTYVNKLNGALEKHPELANKSIEGLLMEIERVPEAIRTAVRNNGGGHANHTMFWTILSPKPGGEPAGRIAELIKSNFGGFESFRKKFNEAGANHFGSGWVWLVHDRSAKYEIITTPNQDSPLMQGRYPVFGNDLWEHAYYLKYKNERPKYLEAWWQVVNWAEINKRLEQAETFEIRRAA